MALRSLLPSLRWKSTKSRRIAKKGPRGSTLRGSTLRGSTLHPAVERLEDRTVPTVSITSNYTGLDFNQSGGFVPPDTVGAAGPSNYVESVNQELAVYSPKATGGTQVRDSFTHFYFTTGGLTRADSGSGLSDPIVAYDELIGRFIVGDQDVNFSTHVSAFDVAVSKTSNPSTLSAGDWNFYKITTTESGFDADYPGNFGYNRDGFVFTLNMFGVVSGGHLQVVAVDANDLANGVTQANLHVYKNDVNDFSVRPTTMHGSVAGDPMWLVTEHGDGTSIDVIKMTSATGTILSNACTFTYTNLPVTAYSAVAPPKNPNGTTITNNIDSRIMKSASSSGTLVATHAVSLSATQDVAQWYAVNLSGATPTLSQQGRVSAGANTYIYYPGIDINPSGQIGMSYMQSGTDTSTDFMSMWVAGRVPTDASGTMETSVKVPAGSGVANYHDFAMGGRAGDLSGINVDPVDGSFWAANEFANNEATANWGTAIANFSLSGPATSADLAVSQTGPSSVTAGSNATYNITLTNNGPDAAQSVVLTDLLPTGSSFVSITPGGSNPDSFTFGQSGGSVTESAASVAAGNTDTFTLVVFAPSNLANGANFSNTVSATSATGDPNSANNSATVAGSIVNNAPGTDLAVTGNGPATSFEGSNVTYTYTVTNNGPTDASAAVLANTLGANLKFVSATTSQGSFSQSGSVVTFSLGTIVNGGAATVTVTAQSTEDGNVTDSSSVTSGANDPNIANNSASVTTAVSEPPITVSGPLSVFGRRQNNIVVATFTHANGVEPVSAFVATINWGDGRTSGSTITLSGTTYTVRGTHLYVSGFSHLVTTTVTEAGLSPNGGNIAVKMGDERPDLPDHFVSHHHDDEGADRRDRRADSFADVIAAILGRSGGQQAAPLAGASIQAIPQDHAAALAALFANGGTRSAGFDVAALFGQGHARGGLTANVLDVLFALEDSL
ncbi:MAG: DUF11 domain-containing protein [Planctomycetes bacterium]|nr:DUF11 domain-containing protein [Planctomycetota bacterium]